MDDRVFAKHNDLSWSRDHKGGRHGTRHLALHPPAPSRLAVSIDKGVWVGIRIRAAGGTAGSVQAIETAIEVVVAAGHFRMSGRHREASNWVDRAYALADWGFWCFFVDVVTSGSRGEKCQRGCTWSMVGRMGVCAPLCLVTPGADVLVAEYKRSAVKEKYRVARDAGQVRIGGELSLKRGNGNVRRRNDTRSNQRTRGNWQGRVSKGQGGWA